MFNGWTPHSKPCVNVRLHTLPLLLQCAVATDQRHFQTVQPDLSSATSTVRTQSLYPQLSAVTQLILRLLHFSHKADVRDLICVSGISGTRSRGSYGFSRFLWHSWRQFSNLSIMTSITDKQLTVDARQKMVPKCSTESLNLKLCNNYYN